MSIESLAICLNHSVATGTDKLILLGIANHDGDGGAYPSVATLARYANSSERTVQRSIQTLIELGEIRVDRNGGGSANQRRDRRPNRYHILVSCPARCDKTSQHRNRDGVTLLTQRGDTPDVYGVTQVTPEPYLEPALEPEIMTAPKLTPTAATITARYVDAFRDLHQLEPPKSNIGRIAKAAKELVDAYPLELLLEAAESCAASGHANLSSAVSWAMAENTRQQQKSSKGAAAFLRLAEQQLIEL